MNGCWWIKTYFYGVEEEVQEESQLSRDHVDTT